MRLENSRNRKVRAAQHRSVGVQKANIPVTVHVAVGTDTPHTHPAADGPSIGAVTHHDFRLLCSLVRGLHDGGVYLNLGSAVVLPEVFLKAVSVVRNLGYPLANFTTVNFDFLQHYRPKLNVVERPHAKSGGRGFAVTGHHELMIPLLAAALIEGESSIYRHATQRGAPAWGYHDLVLFLSAISVVAGIVGGAAAPHPVGGAKAALQRRGAHAGVSILHVCVPSRVPVFGDCVALWKSLLEACWDGPSTSPTAGLLMVAGPVLTILLSVLG